MKIYKQVKTTAQILIVVIYYAILSPVLIPDMLTLFKFSLFYKLNNKILTAIRNYYNAKHSKVLFKQHI